MWIQLITAREQIRTLAERLKAFSATHKTWVKGHTVEDIYQRVLKLNVETASISEALEALDCSNAYDWLVPRCDLCLEIYDSVLCISNGTDYDSTIFHICESCAKTLPSNFKQ